MLASSRGRLSTGAVRPFGSLSARQFRKDWQGPGAGGMGWRWTWTERNNLILTHCSDPRAGDLIRRLWVRVSSNPPPPTRATALYAALVDHAWGRDGPLGQDAGTEALQDLGGALVWVSAVSTMLECPSISCTTFNSTPAVCRHRAASCSWSYLLRALRSLHRTQSIRPVAHSEGFIHIRAHHRARPPASGGASDSQASSYSVPCLLVMVASTAPARAESRTRRPNSMLRFSAL